MNSYNASRLAEILEQTQDAEFMAEQSKHVMRSMVMEYGGNTYAFDQMPLPVATLYLLALSLR